MPLDKGSAAMGFEIKETKRQSCAADIYLNPAFFSSSAVLNPS